MRIDSASHLSDSTLEQELSHLAASDRVTTVRLLVPLSAAPSLAPADAPATQLGQPENPAEPTALPLTELSAARRIEAPILRPKVTPLSPERVALLTPLRKETHDLLRYVQDLLGHQVPPGDIDAVLNLALRGLARDLEKRKFAATDQPSRGRHSRADSRHIPAEVRRAVWQRDGGQCTFTSDTGHR